MSALGLVGPQESNDPMVTPAPTPPTVDARPGWRPNPLSLVVRLIGLALTGLLAGVAFSIHDHNEDRLLNLELHQAGSVVTAAVPAIQIPLTSAAELAAATNGSPLAFQQYMTAFVGTAGPFVGSSLWKVGDGTRHHGDERGHPVGGGVGGGRTGLSGPGPPIIHPGHPESARSTGSHHRLWRRQPPRRGPPGSSMPRGNCPATGI